MTSLSALRVLFFAHETTWSGAPIQLFHLVTWLQQQGCEVAVAVPKSTTAESGPITAELIRAGVPTFPVLDLSVPPHFEELRTLCGRFDVVIANTLKTWAAVRAANEQGVTVIWYIHESLVARELIAQIPEMKTTLGLADIVVMPTQRTARLYAAWTDRPIEVVPYGIPEVNAASKTLPNESETIRFLLLGTYEARKGQDLFLKAIGKLDASVVRSATFQMAGRVLERPFHESLARDAVNLPSVRLLQGLSHEEAQSAIAATDVLVCSSRDETMPIAILEAMSLGKAIVTTKVGGVAEWLSNGLNALLIPPEDSGALAAALRRCVEERELLDSLGENARRTFAENFSIDRLGERFSALIQRVRKDKTQ
jgi:O-antigen biosynthesis protein